MELSDYKIWRCPKCDDFNVTNAHAPQSSDRPTPEGKVWCRYCCEYFIEDNMIIYKLASI